MKPWFILVLAVISLLLCWYVIGCQKLSASGTYKSRQIIFGNGGGFTGAETAYILLENGQLFTRKGPTGQPQLVKSLPDNISKQLFKKVRQVQSSRIAFDHPGNIYYFIDIKDRRYAHRLVWGDNAYTPPAEVEELYQLLMVSLQE